MVAVTYPGIYVEEAVGFSISVSAGATAVPVIVAPKVGSKETDVTVRTVGDVGPEGAGPGGSRPDEQGGAGAGSGGEQGGADAVERDPREKIGTWLDFLRTRKNGFDPNDELAVAMRAYFENGGGPCYVVPVDKLPEVLLDLYDVTLVVAAGQDINDDLETLCGDRHLRFAILDGPTGQLTGVQGEGEGEGQGERKVEGEGEGEGEGDGDGDGFSISPSSHAAMYYPWLKAKWTDRLVPPSAAVAGVYCSVDRQRGVWKAPANVALKGGLKPAFAVSDSQQAEFTVGIDTAINMIRSFRGADAVVWGARTLKATDDNWRYVSVRRLFDTVERDLKVAMLVAMFEVNASPTWERVRGAIDNYLHDLWRDGGLVGAKPEEAYFVQTGRAIMNDEDIKQGIMRVEVGIAAVRPAEFIILRFTQDVVPA